MEDEEEEEEEGEEEKKSESRRGQCVFLKTSPRYLIIRLKV